jgi:hypothetical protein
MRNGGDVANEAHTKTIVSAARRCKTRQKLNEIFAFRGIMARTDLSQENIYKWWI